MIRMKMNLRNRGILFKKKKKKEKKRKKA